MINWKAVIIGFILAVTFALILTQIVGEFGSYIGVIMAGIIIGYGVNRNLVNGAVHGGLIGVIGGIAALIIILVVGGGPYLMGAFGVLVIGSIILDTVLGAIGGAIGSIIA